jgi:cell division protein FtsL
MLKLLLCLTSAMLLAVLILQLRQQKLELNHQANKLHNQIEAQQAKLWNQQLQIAVYTAPNAIQQTVGQQQFKLVPRSPLPARKSNWIDATTTATPAR